MKKKLEKEHLRRLAEQVMENQKMVQNMVSEWDKKWDAAGKDREDEDKRQKVS